MLKFTFQYYIKFTRNLLVKFTRIYSAIYYEVRLDFTKREQNHAIELIARKLAIVHFF